MGSEVRLRSITITGFRRPYAFRAMLGTLLANDLAGWRILIQVEPSPVAEDFAAIATELLAGHDHDLVFNASRLGIDENPLRLIERAFAEGSELNLYLEEDLLLAPDVTRLASWFEQNHRPDWLCLSLISGGCASAGLLSNADYPALLFAGRNFNSLGFAVRRAEWHGRMRAAWAAGNGFAYKHDGIRTGGWDWSIYMLLIAGPQLRTVQPALARATHNGRLAGEFCTPAFHDRAFADLPTYDGKVPIEDYRLVPIIELPSVVRRHALLWQEMTQALGAISVQARRLAAQRVSAD